MALVSLYPLAFVEVRKWCTVLIAHPSTVFSVLHSEFPFINFFRYIVFSLALSSELWGLKKFQWTRKVLGRLDSLF